MFKYVRIEKRTLTHVLLSAIALLTLAFTSQARAYANGQVSPGNVTVGSSTDQFVGGVDTFVMCSGGDYYYQCSKTRVVTSFSVRAGATGGNVQLSIYDGSSSTGGKVIGQSDIETAVANSTNSFDTRIPLDNSEYFAGIGTIGTGPELSYTPDDPSRYEIYTTSPAPALDNTLTLTTVSGLDSNLSVTTESDNDGDGYGDDSQDSDDDNDNVTDSADNCQTDKNSDQANQDLDTYGDACDDDDDNDGATDYQETTYAAGISLTDRDSDDDGIQDGDEGFNHFIVPITAPPAFMTSPIDSDSDDDGLSDGLEAGVTTAIDDISGSAVTGTDTSKFTADSDSTTTTETIDSDTDNDGILDGTEDRNHNGKVDSKESDPNKADSDADSIPDGIEDRNHNGACDTKKVRRKGHKRKVVRRTESCAYLSDTDKDGLEDGKEDADHDGKRDRKETSAFKKDTDGDGKNDRKDRYPLNRKRR